MAVKSSRDVFEVLQVISKADGPLGAADLAKLLGLPITTAARALSTLEAAGYVARHNGSAKFVLGKSGRRLAYAFMARFPIRDMALPYLQQLTLLSGCSSSLFVRLGWYAVRIALITGTGPVVQVGAIGEARPLTASAPSLAILAQLPEADFARAVARHGGEAGYLARLCAATRKRGYASGASAMQQGGHDLAFPLPLAAITLEGLTACPEAALVDQALQVFAPLRDVLAHSVSALTPHYEHVDPDEISLD